MKTDQTIATASNHNTEGSNSLFAWMDRLSYAGPGKYRMEYVRGAALARQKADWLTREEAVDWVATEATDDLTGYGYTREQAERIVDGENLRGQGWRKR
jgi:hypothetical protein